MPESAEVKRLQTQLKESCGRVIQRVEVESGRYTKKPIVGLEELPGYTISDVLVKGKLLVFKLAPPEKTGIPVNILSTLGMTGWWSRSGAEPGEVVYRHTRIKIILEPFVFKNEDVLHFIDARNFGTFKIVTDRQAQKKLDELGPDIFNSIPDEPVPPALYERLQRFCKKRPIAEVLLDQRVFCGVGNYIRADALYLAKIDPRTKVSDLSNTTIKDLWDQCQLVSYCAYHNIGVANTGDGFYNVCYGQQKDEEGRQIESYDDTNGRRVWWCPSIQTVTS